MRHPVAVWCVAGLGLATGAIGWYRGQTLAARKGARLEQSGRSVEELRATIGRLEERLADEEARTARLRARLGEALARAEAVTELAATTAAEIEAAREQRRERILAATRAMPEGVRLTLRSLQELLARDGYPGLRFLRARAVAERELLGVEMIEFDSGSLLRSVYLAGRMTAALDRATGRLELRFFDGHRLVDGRRESFPGDGLPVVLPDVSVAAWERRLPHLVRASGQPPEPEAGGAERYCDPATLWAWRQRVMQLLEEAGTAERLRLAAAADFHGGSFLEVLLLGYEEHRLVMSAEAGRMRVLVDDAAGIVQLELRDGWVRRARGRSELGGSGHRILLPDVTPDRARDLLMGMVHGVE